MYRVIIADDEPKVAQLIKNLIEWDRLNLELAATAQDGISALELIREHQPDIVITDIRMPGYDGIELIRYAKETNPNIDFVIISGYQHFDYAHNAIKYGVKDYLLKPLNKNEINATLAKMTEKYTERTRQEMHCREDIKRLKNELLQGIYNGSGIPAPDGQSQDIINHYCDLHFIPGLYQAFVVKPDIEYQPNNQDAIKMLLNKISKSIEQNLEGICEEALLLLLEDRIFVLANYQTGNRKLFRKALNNILDESNLFRDIFRELTVTISLGSAQDSLDGMLKAARELRDALDDRLVTGGGKIVQYDPALHSGKEMEPLVTFEKRKKLIDLIELFDVNGTVGWITGIQEEALRMQDISGRYVLDTIGEIIEIILFALKNRANVNTEDERLIKEFHESLLMQNNIRTAFELTVRYVASVLQDAAEQRRNEINRPIKDAQKYINTHYAANVSLEDVAGVVGFNPTYFSTLFKKETGMNFLEYVTAVRIKSAKQLLSDSKKSTIDVSLEVGYSDFKHFTKQFKKVTGLTPSEYRKLYY